jgi:hypothetical protein
MSAHNPRVETPSTICSKARSSSGSRELQARQLDRLISWPSTLRVVNAGLDLTHLEQGAPK